MTAKCTICGEPGGRLRPDSVTDSFMLVCCFCLASMNTYEVQQKIDWNDARQAAGVVLETSRVLRRQDAECQEASQPEAASR